jgi:hypothetical protein
VQDEGRTRARGNATAAHEAVPAERPFAWPSDLYNGVYVSRMMAHEWSCTAREETCSVVRLWVSFI